ncbi:transmembrane protein, partial [mine drainage metagenome]
GSGSGATTAYSVGGTVSGLSASGLVLTDNGGNNLMVPSGASTFTFSTKLSSGANYDVAVASQPSAEDCLVTSGATGTVSGNVTNVVVTCSGSDYTVSGTLTGLSTAGLKLQDYNGGETLSVAAGATSFQFTQPVMYGTDVDVTVSTQPFWQACTAGSSNYTGPITGNLTSDY